MDKIAIYLYNIIIMYDYRAIFDLSFDVSNEPLHVNVIAFRKVHDYVVNVPSGTRGHFFYLFHEQVQLMTGQGLVEVPANTFIIFPPGVPIYMGRPDLPWHGSWLRCCGQSVKKLIQRSGLQTYTPYFLSDAELCEGFLHKLHDEMKHPRGADMINLEMLLQLWLRNINRETRNSRTSEIPLPFRKSREYIEANLHHYFTLDTLARHAGISKSYLCKGFKQYYGNPPLDYAIKLRLQEAVELLHNADMNISEIALRCGYDDVFYFSKLFKKHLGSSPASYRKHHLLREK